MKRHSFKKAIILAVVAAILLTCAPLVSMAQSFDDVSKGFWAGEAIKKWSDAQVLTGSNGKFRPNDQITRAEFAAVLNKIMKYDKGNAVFSDVKPSDWFYSHITAVASAGVMNGYDGKAMPNAIIKRQDAAIMIKKAFSIKNASSNPSFNDANKISGYALEAVAALFEKEFISGKPGKLFDPHGGLTRAEAVKIVSNVIPNYIYKPGTYTALEKGNVVVNCPGVIIKGVEITGDLIVAPSVGNTITLVDVKVSGSVITLGKTVVKEETTTPTDSTNPSTPSNPSNPTNPTEQAYCDTYENALVSAKVPQEIKDYIKIQNGTEIMTYKFVVKPSVFPVGDNVTTSVFSTNREYLWIGNTQGIIRLKVSDGTQENFNDKLKETDVKLLIDDGKNGVWAITPGYVTHVPVQK
ncbi:S-layer homology domain-containing protein [Ruminiclostridium papyrosolvens]|uniref:S-layer protein n=1 Tax=Ruminiclostridium papyrosolvens C7 TaxID=1330534 RepID=U4R613_9FIRM|nr:S-layer homology domain-containing protein [Ruminiclostridium papyrosolvens]EPR14064.1 S-layer protein [Ruminiclostridium papyrosolvens C7]